MEQNTTHSRKAGFPIQHQFKWLKEGHNLTQVKGGSSPTLSYLSRCLLCRILLPEDAEDSSSAWQRERACCLLYFSPPGPQITHLLTPSPPHLLDCPLSLTASATLAFVFLEQPKHIPAPGPLHLPFFSAECLFLPLFTYLFLIFSKCQKMSLFRGLLDYCR